VFVPPDYAWRLVLAFALGGAILAAAWAKAPARAVPRSELRWLVGAALALYAVGVGSSLTRHPVLAVVLYAAAVAVSALAAWLSRSVEWGGGSPPDEEAADDPPPSGPGDFDWAAFEREFRAYERRRRETTPSR
jgi:hypothetical protein